MRLPVSPRVARVPYPPISAVRDQLARRRDDGLPLIDLCQAVPDYPPAAELRAQLSRFARDGMSARYTPDEGLPEVRASVAGWYRRRYGSGPEAAEILLTVGASQAFWLAMTVLCGEGDEVIVPLPAYFDHPMGLQALGIEPRYVASAAEARFPRAEELEGVVSARTRALLLVSPNNPSGAVIPPAALDELFLFCRAHELALVVDETYNAFLPSESSPHHLFSRPDWQETFVHLASFGKTFAMTGYRAGALVAAREFLHQALKVQDSMAVCQPRLTQLALGYACDRLDDWVTQRNREVQQRQRAFQQALSSARIPFTLLSSGGFFAWVRHPFTGMGGSEVVARLIDRYHLACLPGEAFGPGLEDCLRLAIGNLPAQDIPEAVERLAGCACEA